jgi:hypothetical protein
LYRPVPELDVLLVRPNIGDPAQAMQGHAHEPTPFFSYGREHPFDGIGFKHHVIGQIKHKRCCGLIQQELALFGHAAPRHVPVELHTAPQRSQNPCNRRHLARFGQRSVFGLVGYHHSQAVARLRNQRGQGYRQRAGAVVCGDQHINVCH